MSNKLRLICLSSSNIFECNFWAHSVRLRLRYGFEGSAYGELVIWLGEGDDGGGGYLVVKLFLRFTIEQLR